MIDIQRYPLTMHRGTWPNIHSIRVHDEAEERAASEKGYTTDRPIVPSAEEPKVRRTLEERVQALEDAFAELTGGPVVEFDESEEVVSVAPRKRGRPKKGE